MMAPAQFFHALADETRWRIVRLVFDEALCVCELADILQMPPSSVSSHVQILRKAGLLAHERCEKWIYYRLERRVRAFLGRLGTLLTADAATEAVWQDDAYRAHERLARREASCCPGPKKLAGPRRRLLMKTASRPVALSVGGRRR